MATPRGSFFVFVVLVLFSLASADVYLQHPRGSNNKLNEVSNGRNNANRLFDSQNNANGGYHVGDNCVPSCNPTAENDNPNNGDFDKTTPGAGEGKMYYHAGSYLQIEWTNQHGCGSGNPWVNCEIIIQYACEDTLNQGGSGVRDGTATNTIGRNEDNNNNNGRKPRLAESQDQQYGQHESFEYYQDCKSRERNKGLFTAGRLNSNNNQQTAIYTRQNSNANRNGFECAEERDYYPYWHPTPWRDIAVLTDNPSRCRYYQEESQNVRNKGRCEVKKNGAKFDCATNPVCHNDGSYNNQNDQTGNRNRPALPNNRGACQNWGRQGKQVDEEGTWYEEGAHNTWAPECRANRLSRINHHGNTEDGEMNNYVWQIPYEVTGKTCVLRLRYNITTSDFDGWSTTAADNGGSKIGMKNDPVADFIGMTTQDPNTNPRTFKVPNDTGPLTLSVSNAQFFRTFEDRTHVFEIASWPEGISWPHKIFNFGVRGRRGNIEQNYPALEYDFVYPKGERAPDIQQGDFLHFQWTGSDANPTGNAGNGRQGTDRSNFVQVDSLKTNKPKSLLEDEYECYGESCERELSGLVRERRLDIWGKSMFDDVETVKKLAYLQQEGCDLEINTRLANNANNRENSLLNCGYLNAAPAYFDGGLVQMNKIGTFHFMSTRNNNFSNRAQKGSITIRPNLLIMAASLVGISLLAAGVGGFLWFRFVSLPAHAAAGTPTCCMRTCFGAAVKRRQRRIQAEADDGEAAGGLQRQPSGLGKHGDAQTCTDRLADKIDEWWGYEGARVRVVITIFIANVAMFGYGFIRHEDSEAPYQDAFGAKIPGNPLKLDYFPWAKAGGAMLNLNCSLILIPVLRNLLSWLRTTPAGDYLPLDLNIW